MKEPAMRPSAEAQALAYQLYKWSGYTFIDGRVMEAIDTLIAQAVSAERERWQNLDGQRLEQIERLQATVQSLQSASAERPGPPSVAADYTERALTVARDAIEGVPDHLLPYRINSEEIAQAIAPHIADALSAVASEREAAAIRAFGERVWSDTEEVAYQAGVNDTRAKIQEPEVREAVIEALRKSRWPNIKKLPPLDGLAPGIRKMYERNADAALTKIAETLK